MTLTPAAQCPIVGGKAAAATVVIARKRKKTPSRRGEGQPRTKRPHAGHVHSSWVGGVVLSEGLKARENHRESTGGRRTTNRPLVRGRTNMYCARCVCTLRSARTCGAGAPAASGVSSSRNDGGDGRGGQDRRLTDSVECFARKSRRLLPVIHL